MVDALPAAVVLALVDGRALPTEGVLPRPSRSESVPLTLLANGRGDGRADQREVRRIPSSESVIRCCL